MSETPSSTSALAGLDPQLSQQLGSYLLARQAARDERVGVKWGSLSVREQALVREAAVMGYVQGRRVPDAERDFPGDTQILHLVLSSVDSFADLYPYLSALPHTPQEIIAARAVLDADEAPDEASGDSGL